MIRLFGVRVASAALISFCIAAPAAAQSYNFDFSTTTPLLGAPGAGSGLLTTDGITFDSRGYTAQTITGITGTFNGSAITGLGSLTGANNLYYLTGPSFLDGSGLGFMTAAGTNVNLFYQDFADRYQINTTNPFTVSTVRASSSAAVAAVPEPATWAMMLFGFGGVGFSMRSARRKTMLKYATA